MRVKRPFFLSLSLSLSFFFFPFLHGSKPTEGFLVTQLVKNLPTVQEIRVQSLGLEDRLEKEMATHFSTLAWKIPWTAAQQASPSLGFPSQEHWSGLLFPSPMHESEE